MKQKLRYWLPKIQIVAAVLYVITLIIDLIAPKLKIINSGAEKFLVLLFCVNAIIIACFMLSDVRGSIRLKQRKLLEARRKAASGGRAK